MNRIIYGQEDLISQFVAQLVPHCARGFGPCRTMGVIGEGGKLIAGLVYHNYDPEAGIIEISGAAVDPRWLSAQVLQAMFEYPFVRCDCQMVCMRVRADNERLLRQLATVDFVFHRLPRLFGRAHDGVVCTLTDDDWLNNRFSLRRYQQREQKQAA